MKVACGSLDRRCLPRLASLAVSIWVTGCALGELEPADPHLRIALVNAGSQPLHCRLMYGHWVDRDLGILAPDAAVTIAARQQLSDGALYVLRADGKRRMMIETILCGADSDWRESYGQVDLAPARAARPGAIAASCAAPTAGRRTLCAPVRLDP